MSSFWILHLMGNSFTGLKKPKYGIKTTNKQIFVTTMVNHSEFGAQIRENKELSYTHAIRLMRGVTQHKDSLCFVIWFHQRNYLTQDNIKNFSTNINLSYIVGIMQPHKVC